MIAVKENALPRSCYPGAFIVSGSFLKLCWGSNPVHEVLQSQRIGIGSGLRHRIENTIGYLHIPLTCDSNFRQPIHTFHPFSLTFLPTRGVLPLSKTDVRQCSIVNECGRQGQIPGYRALIPNAGVPPRRIINA